MNQTTKNTFILSLGFNWNFRTVYNEITKWLIENNHPDALDIAQQMVNLKLTYGDTASEGNEDDKLKLVNGLIDIIKAIEPITLMSEITCQGTEARKAALIERLGNQDHFYQVLEWIIKEKSEINGPCKTVTKLVADFAIFRVQFNFAKKQNDQIEMIRVIKKVIDYIRQEIAVI